MSAEDYIRATKYENLIRNAFNCPRGPSHGADLAYMQNAMTMERGEKFAKHLGTFEKQFEKVKKYVSKALIKLSKTNTYKKEGYFFLKLEQNAEQCSSTEQLLEIVDTALDKVIELKKDK